MKVSKETGKSWFMINGGGESAVRASYFNIEKRKSTVLFQFR